MTDISIHALLAESDVGQKRFLQKLAISIHALLAESDWQDGSERMDVVAFLSTLSLRRATRIKSIINGLMVHFYPRSPCGERPDADGKDADDSGISIHALLAESDHGLHSVFTEVDHFYPRSPCGERLLHAGHHRVILAISIHALLAESDKGGLDAYCEYITFLSTLSLRRATSNLIPQCSHCTYFYPRSPCGERPAIRQQMSREDKISIHALLAESDSASVNTTECDLEFLSTLSLRRATVEEVSGDTWTRDFYPRSPCGERPIGPLCVR